MSDNERNYDLNYVKSGKNVGIALSAEIASDLQSSTDCRNPFRVHPYFCHRSAVHLRRVGILCL